MNIIVKPYASQLCYCRPDTSWEKESRDFYVPDGVTKILWTPVAFARVSKAGKCVGSKFVSRYYDAVGFGVLLYCDDDGLAFSSCIDHTSLLPMPLYNPVVFENEENTFHVNTAGKDFGLKTGKKVQEALEDALCKSSERVSLRIGDMVAVELASMEVLAENGNGDVSIKAEYCGNGLFDLKVIF